MLRKTTKISFVIPHLSQVNLPSSEVNGIKTLLTQQFERKIGLLLSMNEISSFSHQKDVGLVLVLLSLSKCFIQKIIKVKLLEQPTTWLRAWS